MNTMHRNVSLLAATALAAVTLVGCGSDDTAEAGPENAANSAESNFPLTVENCGEEATFEEPPERSVFLSSNDVTLVGAVDALDRFVAKAGEFPVDLYDETTREAVEEIPDFGAGQEADGSGTVQVSLEEVLDLDPDLVIGYEPEGSGVTVDALAQAGIPLIVIPSFCSDPAEIPQDPDFDDIYERIEFYGQLFDADAEDTAAAATELRERVDAVAEAAEGAPERTAATLFVYADDTPPSAYGTRSISHALMETAGFTNVFEDIDERVFETNFEEIIDRDPDVIVLLYTDSDPEVIKEAFVSLPGAETLTAVQNDDILAQDFDLTGSPSPLVVDGLENFVEAFGSPP